MFIKTFVGKDRAIAKAAAKKKARYTGPAPTCRNCGDDYNAQGACVKCRASLDLYREIDDAKFRAFQGQRLKDPRVPAPAR